MVDVRHKACLIVVWILYQTNACKKIHKLSIFIYFYIPISNKMASNQRVIMYCMSNRRSYTKKNSYYSTYNYWTISHAGWLQNDPNCREKFYGSKKSDLIGQDPCFMHFNNFCYFLICYNVRMLPNPNVRALLSVYLKLLLS